MRILSNDDVTAILRMPDCVATLEAAYRDLGNRDAADIPRQDLLVPNGQPGGVHAFKTMSGSWPRAGITALRLNSDVVSWPVKDGVQRRVKIPAANGRWVGLV
ncbi:MAG: ornithine cyclodeaminase family protein, partial [Vulcanimicrobiaceae bacterium]